MPFTPFHFGPGLLLKAVAPTRFSFVAYAATQVVVDFESGYYLLTWQTPVHRTLHTFAAGGLVGALVGLGVGAIGPRMLRAAGAPDAPAWQGEARVGPSVLGGFIGGLAHSLLDGIMHPDIRPFRPFMDANPLFGLLDLPALYSVCVVSGVLGLALLFRSRLWRPPA